MPAGLQHAAEGGELPVGRPPPACNPDWALPDQRPREPAQSQQTAPNPEQQLGRLRGEDQRRGAGAGVPQARRHHPAAARVAMADRDLRRRLPQIELADLPRSIDGALTRSRRREQRPHLAQVVIDDRLAARKTERRDQLRIRCPGSVGSSRSSGWISSLKRIELRPRRRPLIPRRRRRPQRPPDRVAIPPGPARDLPDREASTKCIRRISAHCSTPTNDLLLARLQRANQGQRPPPCHSARRAVAMRLTPGISRPPGVW
jgi:hypothetical protein